MTNVLDALRWFLGEGLSPHSICLQLEPWALKYGSFGQFAIWTAYVLALPPLLIGSFIRASRDGYEVTFTKRPWVVLLFAGFILLCGIGHFLMWIDYYRGFYRLEALAHTATGLVSWATVVLMPFMVKVVQRVPLEEARELWHAHSNLIQSHMALRFEYARIAGDSVRAVEILAQSTVPKVPARFMGQPPRS